MPENPNGRPARPEPPNTYGPAACATSTPTLLTFTTRQLREAEGQVEAEMRRLEAIHRGDTNNLAYGPWYNERQHLRVIQNAIQQKFDAWQATVRGGQQR
jgi:hypothetical protein